MDLVYRSKNRGEWEICWMWLPSFISMDKGLVDFVVDSMTQEFKGKIHDPNTKEGRSLILSMNDRVIELICSVYHIDGLKDYLQGIRNVLGTTHGGNSKEETGERENKVA